MSRTKSPATVLNLDNAAGVFLDLLVDLGHLDDKLLALMNDRLLDLDAPGGVIGVDDVRRTAAQLIDEQRGDSDPEYQRTLDLEWNFLFS